VKVVGGFQEISSIDYKERLLCGVKSWNETVIFLFDEYGNKKPPRSWDQGFTYDDHDYLVKIAGQSGEILGEQAKPFIVTDFGLKRGTES